MRQVSSIEHELPFLKDIVGLAVVDHGWSEQADPGMPMLIVIPGEKELRMAAAILDRAKAIREIGPVLHGAKLTFRKRIIIGNVRAAVGLGDAEIRQQKGHRLGCHRGAAIGVNGQLSRLDVLLAARILDKFAGHFRAFAVSDHPADDVAAEHNPA